MIFLNSASSAAVLVFDLPLFSHTDTAPRVNRERTESGIYFRIFEKTQYLMNTLLNKTPWSDRFLFQHISSSALRESNHTSFSEHNLLKNYGQFSLSTLFSLAWPVCPFLVYASVPPGPHLHVNLPVCMLVQRTTNCCNFPHKTCVGWQAAGLGTGEIVVVIDSKLIKVGGLNAPTVFLVVIMIDYCFNLHHHCIKAVKHHKKDLFSSCPLVIVFILHLCIRPSINFSV